ncbi:MAG: hypothetical protein RLN88_04160 [Ekhidna sp.]|uniref:hypothetical protein n=1 Tax=Ekhidna sp. TaxID=2608089 RepID=UPI0032EB06D1
MSKDTLKLKKKDYHVLVPMDEDGNYELYLKADAFNRKDPPEVVEIGTGKDKQVLHVNLSAPVKHRHKPKGHERLKGDHERLYVMSTELKEKIEQQINEENGTDDKPGTDHEDSQSAE